MDQKGGLTPRPDIELFRGLPLQIVVENSHQSSLLSESYFMRYRGDNDCQPAHEVVAGRQRTGSEGAKEMRGDNRHSGLGFQSQRCIVNHQRSGVMVTLSQVNRGWREVDEEHSEPSYLL
jgi:hypothetical protein